VNAETLRQIILAFVQALETGDLLFLDKYLTADVVYIRTRPTRTEVHGKEEVLLRIEPFLRAFPGWQIAAEDIAAEPNQRRVTCRMLITGSNSGDMDFRGFGQGKYAATGKTFTLPPGELALTVRGASICRIDIDFAEGGGLTGIFEQIGPHR
jgi:SnoaL-like domain